MLKRLFLILKTSSIKTRRGIGFVLLVILSINALVWTYGLALSRVHPLFWGLLILAYGLGLRHAVDADHIAAIDNTTRKLMAEGEKPAAVGLFFSLGHSTIVVILSLAVAFSASFIKHTLPNLESTGTIIGTSVSCIFLILIGFVNLIAFLDIFTAFRMVKKNITPEIPITLDRMQMNGLLFRIWKPLFKTVSKSWHMYVIGILFGLGFDTASEVGLLSISALNATKGISSWETLFLPLSFTAGMTLIDSLDGILMLGAYGWAYLKPVRKMYYNLNITFLSVIIAFLIGAIEAIQLLSSKLNLQGSFYQTINNINLGSIGYGIIFLFLLTWTISLYIYKRKGYDRISL